MTPDEIGAYAAGTVIGRERDRMEEHFTACDDCRRDLLAVVAERDRAAMKRRLAITAPVLAAAAVAGLLLLPGPVATPVVGPTLRGDEVSGTRRFAQLAPEDGAEVRRDALDFAWGSEGVGARYRLTMTTGVGDVVWTTNTEGLEATPPPDLALVPGQRYYWRVDALLEGVASSTTGFRSFVITER